MIQRIRLMGKTTIVVANILVALGLLASYLATHISPERAPILAFFGIGYGILLVLNIGFVIFWLLIKKRWALLSLLAIAIGFNHLAAYFQVFPGSNLNAEHVKSVKVFSHNVRLFGWYNWRTNKRDRDNMINRMQPEDADIYCFQEFFHNSEPETFEIRELLKKKLGAPYLHDVYTSTVHKHQHYGIATLSKYPIINQGRINFTDERGNICIYTDIDILGDTVRVYNAHVASIRFTDSNYKFLDELQNDTSKVRPEYREGVNIMQRLVKAYKKRSAQVHLILDHMEKSPYRIIFCGDLNDTPVSYSYGQLSRNMKDSFRESGWGIGNTYLGRFPSFRIDYIFHDERLTSGEYKTHEEDISDHHAISCRIFLDASE